MRSNNLDGLRIVAAVMVMVGHAYYFVGFPAATPRIFGVQIHQLGVYVFFSISGYLIAKSWGRHPRWREYLAARLLRIFPALIVCVTVTALVLGPLVAAVPISDYFTNHGTYRYFLNIALRPVYALPGVFGEIPYANSVNGSLWTLPVEFACYLAVPLLAWKRVRPLLIPAATVGIGLYALSGSTGPVVWGSDLHAAATPAVFFFAGMIIANWVRPRYLRLDVAMIVLVALILQSLVAPGHWEVPMWLGFPYVVLSFGLSSTPLWSRVGRFGDFSYGLYLFAFPIQQTVILVASPKTIGGSLALSLPLVVIAAVASWFLVERPAMRLKAKMVRNEPRHQFVITGLKAPTSSARHPGASD